MPTNARSSTGTVHVHGAEVSTDQTQFWDYAEALAVLVVSFALLAAVWIAAAPRPDADLTQPSIAPIRGTFVRLPNDTRDVYQPETEGPNEIAVIQPTMIGTPLAPEAEAGIEAEPATTTPTP